MVKLVKFGVQVLYITKAKSSPHKKTRQIDNLDINLPWELKLLLF